MVDGGMWVYVYTCLCVHMCMCMRACASVCVCVCVMLCTYFSFHILNDVNASNLPLGFSREITINFQENQKMRKNILGNLVFLCFLLSTRFCECWKASNLICVSEWSLIEELVQAISPSVTHANINHPPCSSGYANSPVTAIRPLSYPLVMLALASKQCVCCLCCCCSP